MAIPANPPTAEEARAERAAHELRLAHQQLACAIDDYRAEHGALPGRIVAGALDLQPSAELLVLQLVRCTDEVGRPSPGPESSYPWGPYLPGGIPPNPLNGLDGLRLAAADVAPNGSGGWIVDPATGQVRSNALAAERTR